MQNVCIVGAKRTPIGSFNGSLGNVPPHLLSAVIISNLLKELSIEAADISQVYIGMVLAAAMGMNPARQAAIHAGIPHETPASTINRVCGSGLEAVRIAANEIALGQADIVIAGGQENMSLAPHAVQYRAGHTPRMGNGSFVDTMIFDGLSDAFSRLHMGVTAENVAEKFKISREDQDQFAANSQNKAEAAQNNGVFKDEIVPVSLQFNKDQQTSFANDEYIRQGVTAEKLGKLSPAFKKDGTVTAGNASGINDGSAILILMSESEAKKRKLKPLATIKSSNVSGVDPSIMGIGPVSASTKALEMAGWKTKELDLIEANEAFAAQAIAVNKEMGWDVNNVNVNGGSIALGHPIGASGARIMVTLLHELQRRKNAKKALATLCIGGGMGIAMCVEKAS